MGNTPSPMTESMYYLLLALREPSHGYALMREIERISHGRVRMGPGTLYGLLPKLMEDSLIEQVGGNGRRKVYALTEAGRSALRYEYSRLQAMVLDGMVLKAPFMNRSPFDKN